MINYKLILLYALAGNKSWPDKNNNGSLWSQWFQGAFTPPFTYECKTQVTQGLVLILSPEPPCELGWTRRLFHQWCKSNKPLNCHTIAGVTIKKSSVPWTAEIKKTRLIKSREKENMSLLPAIGCYPATLASLQIFWISWTNFALWSGWRNLSISELWLNTGTKKCNKLYPWRDNKKYFAAKGKSARKLDWLMMKYLNLNISICQHAANNAKAWIEPHKAPSQISHEISNK